MAKWNEPGVPHKGWQCIGVIDLGEDATSTEDIEYEQCEMCDNERIRYVHIMGHPDYSETLHVGCVCAEKMSGDYDTPRKRETALRNKASRRTNFNKKEWSFNSSKNSYSKKYKGQYITILQSKYGNWGIFFANQKIWDYGGKKILSFEQAKKISFEIFEQYHTTQEERNFLFYSKYYNN